MLDIHKIIAVSLIILMLQACRKDEPEVIVPQEVTLEVQHVFDGQPFYLNTVYRGIDNRSIQLSRIQYYISGITLTDEEGQEFESSKKTLLIDSYFNSSSLGDFLPMHTDALSLNLGTKQQDNAIVSKNLNSLSTNDPLGEKYPNMHWEDMSGYKFLVVEGKVDSDNDEIPDKDFSYHIGTDSLLRNIKLQTHRDINESDLTTFKLIADYSRLFLGIELHNNSISLNNGIEARKMVDNLFYVFGIEENSHLH